MNFPLNAREAVIGNAVTSKKNVFIYGTGDFDGNAAYHAACDHKCWSNWAGTDYNPLSNNCNTFTSTVLSMVYGLSEKKPNLGPSDMVTVHGHCSSSESQALLPTDAKDMPVAELNVAFTGARSSAPMTNGSNFVFLQTVPAWWGQSLLSYRGSRMPA